jgi:hypothetical protein
LNAILWFIYSIFIYYDMAIVNNNKISADIAALSLFIMAALMCVSGFMLGRQPRLTYYPALVVVILNTLLTLMNLSDLLYLFAFIINIIIISLLLNLRKEYFPQS